jgi:hypothetical protein
MIALILPLLLSLPATAGDALQQWVQGIHAPASSIALAQQLPGAPGPIPPAVPTALSNYTRRTLSTQASAKLAAAHDGCIADTTITYVQDEVQSADPVSAHFFASAIHMESTFCLNRGTAAEALAIFRTSAFRTSALPLVTSFTSDGTRSCLGTEAALGGALAPTGFCSQTAVYSGPEFHGVVGWLTENTGGADSQALYYRHYVIVFVDRPGGGVAGFRGVVTRSKDLNMLQRALVQMSAGQAHDLMQEKLEAALSGP